MGVVGASPTRQRRSRDVVLDRRSGRAVMSTGLALMLVLSVQGAPTTLPAAATQTAPGVWPSVAAPPGPPARLHAAMAYDPGTATTVLFGGRAGGELLGDTWTFNGSAWTRRTPLPTPPALDAASAAFDEATHQLVLFGGQGAAGPAAGTWAWDGVTWIPLAPAASPPARYGAGLVYNGATHTLVLFGGLTAPAGALGDTWSWDGA